MTSCASYPNWDNTGSSSEDPGAGEPSTRARRRIGVRTVFAALVLLPMLAACAVDQASDATPDGRETSSLSQDQLAKAEAVARLVVARQGASVSSASVIARQGRVRDSNTGHPCTSGRELQIKLIGTFPNTVTTGHPVPPGSPTPDFTVRAMIITADEQSGQACLIGVQTGENGEIAPLPGAAFFSVD